jgi:hypothetical protein
MPDPTKYDALLKEDWGDSWTELDPAPPLVYAQPKTAQLTLRVPKQTLSRLKEVAASKSLPYHALARSWILEGLRSGQLPSGEARLAGAGAERSSEQLNLKIEPELLEDLKRLSHNTRRPYHALARQWVNLGLAHQLAVTPPPRHATLKELIVLLLDGDRQQQDSINGMTRLQKLLFVIQQELDKDSSTFYSYKFGPFDDQVIDCARALRLNGFLAGSTADSVSSAPPSFEHMMATVAKHSRPPQEAEVFELSEAGRAAAETLRSSDAAFESLHSQVQELRTAWDTPDLLERVYETFPEMTDRSLIKEEVDERRARRRGQSGRR